MPLESIHKIIIKVGKSTVCRLNGFECFKALTVSEVIDWCEILNDTDVLIIVEQLYSFEVMKAYEEFKDIKNPILIDKRSYSDDINGLQNVTYIDLADINNILFERYNIKQFKEPRTEILLEWERMIKDVEDSEAIDSVNKICKSSELSNLIDTEKLTQSISNERNDYEAKLHEIEEQYIKIKGNYVQKEIESKTLSLRLTNLESELKLAKSKLKTVEKERDVLQETLQGVRDSAHVDSVSNLDIINKQREEISALSAKMNEKDKKVADLGLQILQKNQEQAELTTKIHKLQIRISELTRQLKDEQTAKDKYKSLAIQYQGAFKKSGEQIKTLQEELEKAKNIVIEDDSAEVDKLKSSLAEVTVKMDSLDTELAAKDKELLSLRAYKEGSEDALAAKDKTIESLGTELNKLREDLKDSNLLAQSKLVELRDSKDKELAEAKRAIDKLKSESSGYTATVAQLGNNIHEMQLQIKDKNAELTKLTDEKNRIETEFKSFKNEVQFEKEVVINYKGRARIIPVFGSGSYGVSVMAMSIAHKIEKHRVLIMDLDIRSPKLDKYTQKSPMISSLADIKNPMERSSFTAFLKCGLDYITGNNEVIQTVERRMGGVLDYFGGLYVPIKDELILKADYTSLFNYLGDIYDYIIVDLGILGNPLSDKLIKAITGISYRDVFVTLNCPIDARSALVRLSDKGFRLNNIVWVLNLAKTTKIEASTQQITNKAYERVLMTMNVDMYGSNKTLDRMPITNGMFSKVIELLN